RGAHGPNAGRHLVVAGLETPGIFPGELVGEDPVVETRGEGGELGLVHVNVAPGQLAEPARVVEVQVAENHDVDVLRPEAETAEIARDPLRVTHARRLEPRPHGIEEARPDLGSDDLAVVAADVVEDAAIRGLDEVGEDGRLDELALTTMTCRDDLLVAHGAGHERPEANGTAHDCSRRRGFTRPGRSGDVEARYYSLSDGLSLPWGARAPPLRNAPSQ